MLLTKDVEVKINRGNFKYYLQKGYDISIETNNKGQPKLTCEQTICVNIADLTKHSKTKVLVQCDYCYKIISISYSGYCRLKGDTYCCPCCLQHKKKTYDKNGKLIFVEVPYRNYEWLYTEYIEKGRSAPDIAKECGINERTLRDWINKLGIIDQKRHGKDINKDDLYQLYRIEKRTTKEIEEHYGVGDGVVLYYLHKFNIPVFTRTEILNIHYKEHGGIEKSREIFSTMENRILNSCRQRGIEIENFDDFLTTKAHMERNSSRYKEWRTSVFERDNYTCVCCNKHGGNLNAHHLKNFAKYDDLKYSVSNGVTLCQECHLENYPNSFHSKYGTRNNTPEQFYEYVAQRKKELGIK